MNRRTEVAMYALSALLLAGTAGIWWQGLRPSAKPPATAITPVGTVPVADNPAENGPTPEPKTIFVHIAGAVERPGVYKLKEGQRLFEALALAGLSADADADSLNLASLVRDSQRVYVSRKGEFASVGDGSHTPAPSEEAATLFPLDINSATQSELEQLPGVGPVLAKAIIQRRKDVGPFERPEDLKDVAGIGEKTFAKIAPLITIR